MNRGIHFGSVYHTGIDVIFLRGFSSELTLTIRLQGKRVVVTQADEFMGPALCERFSAEGAHVIADHGHMQDPAAANDLINNSGEIDILVANLMSRNRLHPVQAIADDE